MCPQLSHLETVMQISNETETDSSFVYPNTALLAWTNLPGQWGQYTFCLGSIDVVTFILISFTLLIDLLAEINSHELLL